MKKTVLGKLTGVLAFFFVSGFFQYALGADIFKRVDNEKVCMVTDMYFGKKQIPVMQNGKTYYGCCENCKETLANDSKARFAIDPVSGKSVDKATAFIVAREDNSVLYFESERTFKQYKKKTDSKPSGKKDPQSEHSHH